MYGPATKPRPEVIRSIPATAAFPQKTYPTALPRRRARITLGSMKLLFVHGWSVTSKDTYGELPQVIRDQAAAQGIDVSTGDVFLSRYISFHDEVRMDDLVRAFDRALRDALGVGGDPAKPIPPFSCITHSTGGPLALCWLDRHYGAARLAQAPLEHLIMLAPATHGSALAQLGKAKVGRLKAWFTGVEPGQQILDWLELGSAGQRALHGAFLDYDLAAAHAAGGRFFPVVLTGETIDPALYDYVNSYTGEAGSDGVVRAAAANLNTSWLTLAQTDSTAPGGSAAGVDTFASGDIRRAPLTSFRIIPGASHSGSKIGIMRSVTEKNALQKPVVGQIIGALKINSGDDYAEHAHDSAAWNRLVQETDGPKRRDGTPGPATRYFMFVFRLGDDQGRPVDDFDLILLAGSDYNPDKLPPGFFKDRQKNSINRNTLVLYLNHDVLSQVPDGKIGFRIIARPSGGFAGYEPAEFRSDAVTIDQVGDPNMTTYIDIVLKRRVDREAVRFEPEPEGRGSFKRARPSGEEV